jgi:predicted ATPase
MLKKSLIENLKQYSPIQNLRLSPSLSKEITTNKIEIKYIILEFYVNNQWLDWSQLSDGTRRIFNIISTINGSDRHLTFLEEPENGVHPDQLYLLMDFIKEQSKEKQIIITTHSPEVLNILGKEELDNIIVTRFDDEKGTQMHHLSAEKIKKGIAYMSEEGLALKDFWVNSNLEEFDEDEEN